MALSGLLACEEHLILLVSWEGGPSLGVHVLAFMDQAGCLNGGHVACPLGSSC